MLEMFNAFKTKMMDAYIYELIMRDSELNRLEGNDLKNYFFMVCGDLYSKLFEEVYNEKVPDFKDFYIASVYSNGYAKGYIKEQFRIVFKMLKYKVDLEIISRYTEFSLDLLRDLQKFSQGM